MGSEDIPHAAELEKEILAMFQHLSQFQLLLLQKLMTQIELVPITALYILPIAVHGTKVHVQQGTATVDVELARRDAVGRQFLRVVHLVISC